MILVLLTRLSDSEESISGYKLCQTLAEQGHDLYVTTVTTGESLQAEIKDVEEINMREKGNVTLLHPDYDGHEQPNSAWIVTHHKKYFSYLSKLNDVTLIISMLPPTEETTIELKDILKCRLVLVFSTKIEVSALDHNRLGRLAKEVDEILWVGSEVPSQNDNIFQYIKQRHIGKELNFEKWGRDLSQHIHKNSADNRIELTRSLPSGRILILLYRFNESQECLLGYLLCLKLVKRGHHIYVTTTSTGDWLKTEIQKAEQLTEDSVGSITLLTPQCREHEEPSPEMIANFHKQYFGFLSDPREIGTIIGTLPGTTITGIELKETLKCKLILLATTKIGGGKGELTKEVNNLVLAADEVWSVGPDIHTHYKNIFQEQSISPNVTHREILLQPTTNASPFWNQHSTGQKVVSVWSSPTYFFHNGRKQYSSGSSAQCFCIFSAALDQLNTSRHMNKLQWNIHGLQLRDQIIQQIQGQAKPDTKMITPFSAVTSIDNLPLKHCRAFIVPDYVEENFNFLALSAIWLGIPTLVSSQSSIGKLLLRLNCSEKSRAVVNLTGDIEHDKLAWMEKINTEFLGHDAHSLRWARGLAEHLYNNRQLWVLDISPFDGCTAPAGRVNPKIVSKVENWRRNYFSPESTAPSSSVSSHSTDQSTVEFKECNTHKGKAADIFCQTCRILICHTCRPCHVGHNILEVQEEKRKLRSYLHEWKKAAKEAKKKKIEVLRNNDSIEVLPKKQRIR